jgi:hypothetical protein
MLDTTSAVADTSPSWRSNPLNFVGLDSGDTTTRHSTQFGGTHGKSRSGFDFRIGDQPEAGRIALPFAVSEERRLIRLVKASSLKLGYWSL